MSNNTYNENSIQSLGIIGGVRAKPSSIGFESHCHSLVEILLNAIDESREGYGDKIIVTKHSDNSISVQDFGRSIPMYKNSDGEYAYKKIFEELWSGGKYSNNKNDGQGNYKYSTGTNGLGNFGTNTTSDFLEVTAFAPKKNKYHVKYEKGVQVGEFIKSKHDYDFTGTIIHWIPSKEVFKGENDIPIDFIITLLKQQSIINKGLRLIFINESNSETQEFYYENGAIDYINEKGQNKNITDVIEFSTEAQGSENGTDEEYKIKAVISFCFNNEVNLMEYYHNASYLENGGTPEDFIKTSFTYAIDKFLRDKNIYQKSDKKISFDDIKDSLIILSDTYSTISLYTDQAKKQIKSKFMNKHMTDFIKQKLEIYFTENSLEANKIANQILINSRARLKAESTKLNIKKKLQSEMSVMNKVDGLIEAKCKDRTKNILTICEGKSSLSAMLSGRNELHAIYPIRGKIMNCLKAPLDKILNSEIVVNLIRALGCGIEIKSNKKDLYSFDIEKLRYSKIYIYVDADFDGMGSILPLLLTVFWKLTPTLVREGRIYICETPKYEIVVGDEFYYAVDDNELEILQNNLTNKRYKIHYIKGLSELSSKTMAMCLNPDYKNITQITLDNIEESIKTLELFMSDDIKPRRDYILNTFKEDTYVS